MKNIYNVLLSSIHFDDVYAMHSKIKIVRNRETRRA